MKIKSFTYKFLPVLILFSSGLFAQEDSRDIDNFFAPVDTFNSTRFYTGTAVGSVAFAGGTIVLYNYWYKEQGFSRFHLFNDWGEWQFMDKIGHIYTAYNIANTGYNMVKWSGLKEQKSLVFGMVAGMLFQSTIEVMDGFSPKWGFSLPDMGANVLGATMFFAQQKYWKQQKILFKVSSYKRIYPVEPVYSVLEDNTTTLEYRANHLFGSTFAQRYLKDYNAQTYWLSLNIKSLLEIDAVPGWLNIAIGYSGENMFGGYDNIWKENKSIYDLEGKYDRYSQILIAPDIDFARIKVHSHLLKTVFKGINILKIPTPALEINTKGEFILHLIYF